LKSETRRNELAVIREHAQRQAEHFKKLYADLNAAQGRLALTVSDYSQKREELIVAEMAQNCLTWCTACKGFVQAEQAQLRYIDTLVERSCGYEGGDYTFRDESNLHRACPVCYAQWDQRHGWRGPYDSGLKTQAHFMCFQAEQREDGYYAKKFGTWEKVPEHLQLPKISIELLEKAAEALGCPPKMETKYSVANGPELVIHEKAAVG
jgi:hypothetical protein